MVGALRLALAVTIVHPLEGIGLGAWFRLLRRERFRVHPICWPRAAWITAMAAWTSVAARAVGRRHGAAIEATRVEAPLFILGHFRSGTTHLHELLSNDPAFASATRFEAFNPRTFVGTESWLGPIVEAFMLPRRVQEDEIAPMGLTGLSPYLDWVFPRSRSGYARYSTFRDAEPAEAEAWKAAMVRFLKALTLQHGGRPLILKSPPHTGRVRLILDAFPDARFVHIRRDPYAVFGSTLGLLRVLPPVFRLQTRPRGVGVDVDAVLRNYAEMYDAYFADRDLIPAGRLVEIAYEDLDRDPLGQLRSIYEGLALGDFEAACPRFEAHLRATADYRKNRRRPLDEPTRLRVASAWARAFAEFGYPT